MAPHDQRVGHAAHDACYFADQFASLREQIVGAHGEHREIGFVDQVDAQPFARFGEADVAAQLIHALFAGHARFQFLLHRFEFGAVGGAGGFAALVLGAG